MELNVVHCSSSKGVRSHSRWAAEKQYKKLSYCWYSSRYDNVSDSGRL